MKSTQKAFTLVELIVVITILAILGTIAFISLQGYSADARNTKRVNDLGELTTSINTTVIDGVSLTDVVTSDPNSTLPATSQIAGTGITDGTDYVAGTPNYTILGAKQADFQDSDGDEYRIAVTTKIDGKYELAASMENGSGERTAKVEGTYVPRTGTATGITVTNMASWSTATTSGVGLNVLKRGDTVVDSDNNTWTIISISSDYSTISLSRVMTGTTLTLASEEVAGLIDADQTDWTAAVTGTPVTNNGTDLPY